MEAAYIKYWNNYSFGQSTFNIENQGNTGHNGNNLLLVSKKKNVILFIMEANYIKFETMAVFNIIEAARL